MSATPQQQAVINQHRGTLLIKACPGSGKTTTLVNRCRALPGRDSKLVLAFNKNAARDFSDRLGSVGQTEVKTFHAYCLRAVRANWREFGFKGSPTLVTETPFFQMVKNANGKGYNSWDESGWDQEYMTHCEHSLYDHELDDEFSNCQDQKTRETLAALITYRNWLMENKILTFDSSVRLTAQNADKLKIAAQHVMVDEYQDVDRFQFDIACRIARIKGVLSFAVVGDPNQRIYEWRGALHDAFHSMKQAFPECETMPLTTNFRSFDGILREAEAVCPTGMTGVRGDASDSVDFVDGIFDPHTGQKLTDKNQAWKTFQQGFNGKLSDCAILCRYNRDAARWQIKLAKDGIPVYLEGKGDFWLMKHTKMAKDAWRKGWDSKNLFDSDDWRKFENQKKFKDDEEKLIEVRNDAKFILSLSKSEMTIMEDNLQDERRGVRISTIHRTKGSEFDRVMVSNVSEHLKSETFVYYVALTRAKNRLVIA